MAQVDIIKADNEELYLMNVTEAVGPNHGSPDDVMLVKALLEQAFFFWGWSSFPKSTAESGTLDGATKENIRTYQKKFNEWMKTNKNSTRLSVDGRVSRARGQYSWDKNRPWTITTLNTLVGLYARTMGFKSAADLILTGYPHLGPILKIDPATV